MKWDWEVGGETNKVSESRSAPKNNNRSTYQIRQACSWSRVSIKSEKFHRYTAETGCEKAVKELPAVAHPSRMTTRVDEK